MTTDILVAATLGVAVWALLARRRRRLGEAAREVAVALAPEVRELMRTADPKAATGGLPADAPRYAALREQARRKLPPEALFAVETFYGSVESYREARQLMEEAFRGEEEPSLGDRIRAKDRRDRCLKDVYYSGEAALEKLESLAG